MSETQTFKPNYEEYNPASYNKEIYGEIPSIEAESMPTNEREVALQALRSLIPTQRGESDPAAATTDRNQALPDERAAWNRLRETRDRQVRP